MGKKKGREEKKRGIQINTTVIDRDHHFRFDSVFIKNITILKLKKKPKPCQIDQFRFG
jgi:hypothetical protein